MFSKKKVFCFQAYCEKKNCSSDREKLLKFVAEGREFAKILRSLNRTIYSNRERSEQFLVTKCFFNFVPGGFSYVSNKLKQLEFKLEKIIGI